MKKGLYVFLLAIIAVVGILLLKPVFGSGYYSIGNGPISDIQIDYIPGQLLIASAHSIFIFDTESNEPVDEYELACSYVDRGNPGNPQNNYIYGFGGLFAEFSLNRTTEDVESAALANDFIPNVQLQDQDKLYAIFQDQSLGPDSMGGKIFVFDKGDLSLENVWPCEMWPELALYDYENQKIIVAQGYTTSYSESLYSPWEEGVQWLSNVGIYNPSRSGELIQEYTIQGSIAGLAQASDGIIIVGLAGNKENWVPASTLAVLSDPIRYVDIENYQVACMDYDTANDRVIASVSIDDSEIGISILVWYYDTGEYEIIESDVHPMLIIKYYDGKAYTSTGKDNRLYVIPID